MMDTGFWVDTAKGGARRRRSTPTTRTSKIIAAPAQHDPHREADVPLRQRRPALDHRGLLALRADAAERRRARTASAFLKAATVELMRTNVLQPRREGRSLRPEPGRHRLRPGLRDRDGSRRGADTPQGKNTFYWGGAFGTWFWIDPTNDLVFVGMIQNLNGSHADRRHAAGAAAVAPSWCMRRWLIRRSESISVARDVSPRHDRAHG